MPPDDRAQTFANAPLDELLGVLLRQLKRPLGAHGFSLTDAAANALGAAGAAGGAPPPALCPALTGVLAESRVVLQEMGFSFRQSLDADVGTLGGWQTTGDFLELANTKVNAELRITVAAALALVFGCADDEARGDIWHLASGAYDDETVIAGRALAAAAGVDYGAPGWLAAAAAWLKG